MPVGHFVKLRDGTLVNDNGSYYIISDGKKLMFSSSNDLSARGYRTSNAIAADLSAYESGETVQEPYAPLTCVRHLSRAPNFW